MNCASGVDWPKGYLSESRGEMHDYFEEEMLKTDDAYFYEAFNRTYEMAYNGMMDDDEDMRWAIMVITHPDVREGGSAAEIEDMEDAEASLLHMVGMALEPDDTVPVYAIHYFGHPNYVTTSTLTALADRTNGAYVSVSETE